VESHDGRRRGTETVREESREKGNRGEKLLHLADYQPKEAGACDGARVKNWGEHLAGQG